jgi:phosphoribosyl-AMP cyclohydrolase
MLINGFLDQVKFDANGLVAAIAQDARSGKVLMLAYMNRDTLKESLATGKMVYWSRSRKKRWLKGEQSGHVQIIREIRIDCDGDALLFRVRQKGKAACHAGYQSCFFRRMGKNGLRVADPRLFDPEQKYGKSHRPKRAERQGAH